MRKDKTKCSDCSVTLNDTNAYTNKRGFNKLDSKCKACRIKYSTERNKIVDRTEYTKRDNAKRAIQRKEHTARRRKRMQAIKMTEGELLFVREYYKIAAELTAAGIPHHVDHIIPLAKGGLHAPWNLQVLTAHDNLKKGARIRTN